jgi:hypothetical protein
VRLAVLRPLAEPREHVVLDAGLRRPREGTRVPAASESAGVVSVGRCRLAAAVTVATCLLLVACGDDQEDSPSSEPTSRPEAGTTVKGRGFTVQMPANPKRETGTFKTDAGPVELTGYLVDRGDEAYGIYVGEVAPGSEPDLDGLIAGTAADLHGTVAEREETEYQGHPAHDVRITDGEADGAKLTTFMRVIGVDDRFYQLEYVAKGADVRAPPDGYRRFLESLEID